MEPGTAPAEVLLLACTTSASLPPAAYRERESGETGGRAGIGQKDVPAGERGGAAERRRRDLRLGSSMVAVVLHLKLGAEGAGGVRGWGEREWRLVC
jgi:hypothetical protein